MWGVVTRVGIVVGTWIVSFVCWDNVDRTLCLSPSLCRDPRDPFARGFAAVPGPDDRPAIWLPFREEFPGSITLAPSPPFAAWFGHSAFRAALVGLCACSSPLRAAFVGPFRAASFGPFCAAWFGQCAFAVAPTPSPASVGSSTFTCAGLSAEAFISDLISSVGFAAACCIPAGLCASVASAFALATTVCTIIAAHGLAVTAAAFGRAFGAAVDGYRAFWSATYTTLVCGFTCATSASDYGVCAIAAAVPLFFARF